MAPLKPKPLRTRLLMVTFDLTDTVPGDARYAAADAALSAFGPVFRPLRQLRLLVTDASSARVRASLEQRVGRDVSILIAPITRVTAWRIFGPTKQKEWTAFVAGLAASGVTISGVSKTFHHP